MKIDEITARYIANRQAIEEIEAECKVKTEKLKEENRIIENKLQKLAIDNGLTSIKSSLGAFTFPTRTYFNATNWEEIWDYMFKYRDPFVLQKRLHNTHIGELYEDSNVVVPGIEKTSEIQVKFIKAKP